MSRHTITFEHHYCPYCNQTLSDAEFITFRNHVLDRHQDNKVLVGAVTQHDDWSPPATIHGPEGGRYEE